RNPSRIIENMPRKRNQRSARVRRPSVFSSHSNEPTAARSFLASSMFDTMVDLPLRGQRIGTSSGTNAPPTRAVRQARLSYIKRMRGFACASIVIVVSGFACGPALPPPVPPRIVGYVEASGGALGTWRIATTRAKPLESALGLDLTDPAQPGHVLRIVSVAP